MRTVTIFVASSSELSNERKALEDFLYQKSKLWLKDRNIFLELKNWEDFIDSVSKTRLQDEYNACIQTCDIFLMVYWTKVGKYTLEEFETALKQFQTNSKPFIYVYYKNASSLTVDSNSVNAFNNRLDEIGHFKTVFDTTSDFILHFNVQLDKLFANKNGTMPETDKSKKKAEIIALINRSDFAQAFEELNKFFLGQNHILNAMIFEFTSNPSLNLARLAMQMKTFISTNL